MMRTPHGRALLLVVSVGALLLAACAPAPGGDPGSGAHLQTWSPHLTDPALPEDTLRPNFSIVAKAPERAKLAVLFNGTGADPMALTKLGRVLSDEGFHVIGLRYDSGVGTYGSCPATDAATFPECHRAFRSEIVFGEGVQDPAGASFDHPSVAVTPTRSVMNRLIKMVDHLNDRYPLNGWGEFQDRVDGTCASIDPVYGGCSLDWSDIVLMGHSQGAGVGLYLSKHFDVHRVGMLSGTADVFPVDGAPQAAPWVAEGGFATERADIASLVHTSDPEVDDHRAVAEALDLPGVEISTTLVDRPYLDSRRLSTSLVPACFIGSAQAHNSTATDFCAPSGMHTVWEYLATGE